MVSLRKVRTFGARIAPTKERDPAKVYVIATEGKTEFLYFKGIQCNKELLGIHSNIIVEPIERDDTDSAPKHVVGLLEEYVKYFGIEAEELWIVVDRDEQNNTPKQLLEIQNQSLEKGFNVGLSNPCFELWLLLHVADLGDYRLELLLENKKVGKKRRYIEKEISNVTKGYNKSNLKFSRFIGGIESAIRQAKCLENNVDGLIESLGTNMHILVESILNNKN